MRFFEDGSVVVRRQFDQFSESQAACFDGFDGLSRRHPQPGPGSARRTKNNRLLTWTVVPVDDCNTASRFEDRAHGAGQKRLIGHAVKCVRHEDETGAH